MLLILMHLIFIIIQSSVWPLEAEAQVLSSYWVVEQGLETVSNTRAYFLNHQAILPPFSFSSSFDECQFSEVEIKASLLKY